MTEKGEDTLIPTFPKWPINQSIKPEKASDGGKENEDKLIPTFPNWPINQWIKPEKAPDSREGDEDQHIPTFFLHAVPGIQPAPHANNNK